MRRPLIIDNWKMNTNLADATILTNSVKNHIGDLDVDVILCPPSVWLYPMTEILEKSPSNLHLGAQNMYFSDSGAITGEISPLMVKALANYVIVGHSERRKIFGETDEFISDKIDAALKHNLKPIVCVGEIKKMEEERKGPGRPTKVDVRSDVLAQLRHALSGVSRDDIEKVIIAYEPVWAISKGTANSRHAATGAYAASVIEKLRNIIADKYGEHIAQRIRILYGGSVDEDNIKEFIYQPEIDGVLIGGASLKAKEFIKICREAGGKD
jgi:triosephosphate isomerase